MREKDAQKAGFARLLELAGKKRRKLTAACLLAVLSSAARMIPFFTIYGILSMLISAYLDTADVSREHICLFAGVTLLAALIYGICAYASSALAHTAAYDIIYELRMKLLNKLAKLPSGYFTGTTQGSLKKILSDDTEQIEVFIAHHLCDIAVAIATPLFTLVYLFFMDARLALVTLIPIIISIILLGVCLARPDKAALQVEMHDAQEAMQGTIVEYIHGMPVVKIFNRNLSAFKRYEGDIERFVNAVEKTAKANAWPMAAYYAFFGAQMLFLLPAGSYLLINTSSYLDFLPVLFLFFLVGGGLKEAIENMMQMVLVSAKITEGIRRIDGILQAQEIVEGAGRIPKEFDVSFEDVSFSYQEEVQAVTHVSFSLEQGSVTGLVGPSGGGKSTLAQLLLRFHEVGEGRIRIGGIDIREIPQEALTRIVSYVFQDSFLFHDTVENNIRMGNKEAGMEQVIEAAKNAGIHEVIMKLPKGYQTVIGEKDAYLSGGEKQRLAIARVFLRNTPIVVLDEATAYADAENEAKIQAAFAKLAKEKTVLIIAHRLKTIEKADQILVMKNGELMGKGTHQHLLSTCSEYKNMVDANERRDRWTIKKSDREEALA